MPHGISDYFTLWTQTRAAVAALSPTNQAVACVTLLEGNLIAETVTSSKAAPKQSLRLFNRITTVEG